VNISKGGKKGIECDCKEHVEITNFTITEIETKNAICMKRIVKEDKSYLAIMYD
jgi:hypothetical protein